MLSEEARVCVCDGVRLFTRVAFGVYQTMAAFGVYEQMSTQPAGTVSPRVCGHVCVCVCVCVCV